MFTVLWKRPLVGSRPMDLSPELPDGCRNLSEPARQPVVSAEVERLLIKCNTSFAGKTIAIKGLPATETDALLRLQLADGTSYTTVLRPDDHEFRIPAVPSGSEIIMSYLLLGIEHILGGFDHLLFVLGLLLIVANTRLLVATITAFTLAHSFTLAMAVFNIIQVPQTPVEAIIALSILFLATEIIHTNRGKPGLTARRPWLVALCFGLLHGLGFAGALAEIGMPQNDIPLALLFFNLGVEIGQLVFIAGVIGVQWMAGRIISSLPGWTKQVPAYAIGSLAAFWVIQRTMSFW